MKKEIILDNTVDKNIHLIGELIYLMSASSIHKYFRIIDINNNIIPAIQLNQYRIYRHNNRPIGFVSWAYFSNEIEKKFTSGPTLLKIEDWKSGDNLFFVDFIAPFGHAKKIIQDLTNNVFPDRIAKSLRFKEPGKLHRISKFHGKNVLKNNHYFHDNLSNEQTTWLFPPADFQ